MENEKERERKKTIKKRTDREENMVNIIIFHFMPHRYLPNANNSQDLCDISWNKRQTYTAKPLPVYIDMNESERVYLFLVLLFTKFCEYHTFWTWENLSSK